MDPAISIACVRWNAFVDVGRVQNRRRLRKLISISDFVFVLFWRDAPYAARGLLARRHSTGIRVGMRSVLDCFRWFGATCTEAGSVYGVSWTAFAVSAPSRRNQSRYAKLVRRVSWIAFVGLAPLERKQSWYAEFLRLLSLYRRHLDGIRDGMRSFLDCFRRFGTT